MRWLDGITNSVDVRKDREALCAMESMESQKSDMTL